MHTGTCPLQEKSSRGIDPRRSQSIVVGKVGGNQSSNKASYGFDRAAASVVNVHTVADGPLTEDLGWG